MMRYEKQDIRRDVNVKSSIYAQLLSDDMY